MTAWKSRNVPTASSKREECCVCLCKTSHRTACGHSLCKRCVPRLRRPECPYCRRDLNVLLLTEEDISNPVRAEEAIAASGADVAAAGVAAASLLQKLQRCRSFEQLHEVAFALKPSLQWQPPTLRRALLASTARRCCDLLHIGWASVADGLAAVPFLLDLREEQLLEPLHDVQLAALDALLELGRKAGAHSFLRWSGLVTLLSKLAEAKLLSPEGHATASGLLEVELRRFVRVATAAELGNLAIPLAEAVALLTAPPDGEAKVLQALQVPGRIRALLSDAVQLSDSLQGTAGLEAAQARDALQAAGLLAPGSSSAEAPHAQLQRPPSASSRPQCALRRPQSAAQRLSACGRALPAALPASLQSALRPSRPQSAARAQRPLAALASYGTEWRPTSTSYERHSLHRPQSAGYRLAPEIGRGSTTLDPRRDSLEGFSSLGEVSNSRTFGLFSI